MKINKIAALFLSLAVLSFTPPLFAEEGGDANVSDAAEEMTAPPPAPEIKDVKIDKKIYHTRTKDGWDIAINRFIETGKDARKPRAAVILCHGFNINDNFWDLDKRVSLARYLARADYDVWTPSLRGSGDSSKPVASRLRSVVKLDLKSVPDLLTKTPFDITKFGWTIDDHINEDLPAIVDIVRKKSGFDKVYWIGHSMGGIVMFGYLEKKGDERIAGFVPVGSMMFIPKPLSPALERIAGQKPLLTASLVVNTTVASQLSNFTMGAVKNPIEELLLKRKNMDDAVLFKFFRTCIDDTSAGVVSQFSDSIRDGEIRSRDGRYNYTANMDKIKVPILFMAGGDDAFVSQKALKMSYDAVKSKDKQMIVFSKENGYTTDYGHCDLLLGKNSGKDVYSEILTWLDKRTIPAAPAGN